MKKHLIAAAFAAFIMFGLGSAASAQHFVTKGETMFSISQEFNMNLADLISLNKHIKNPNMIKPGDYIVIRTETEKQADLIDYAKSLESVTAYKYGGQQFPESTDCSGWVQGIFKKFGVQLPRVSRDQAKVGTPVKFEQLQVGDLLFFSTRADKVITHVGIKLDNDYWISNLNENKDVEIMPVWGSWFRQYFLYGSRIAL
jgi:cell wall-associated NlpC family hydrolase